jgi:hypothetical protein
MHVRMNTEPFSSEPNRGLKHVAPRNAPTSIATMELVEAPNLSWNGDRSVPSGADTVLEFEPAPRLPPHNVSLEHSRVRPSADRAVELDLLKPFVLGTVDYRGAETTDPAHERIDHSLCKSRSY